jgi:hydroxyethylthiazole kinase-like uncharacterized protein yjeF
MSTSFKRLTGTGFTPDLPLYDQAALRGIEQTAIASLGSHVLMQRAGLAIAQCAMALAPHSRKIWIPCGPGNNGGDGLEAAMHLRQWGKGPVVSLLCPGAVLPADAAQSLQRAQQAGVAFIEGIPEDWDFCVDALFGIGSNRPLEANCEQWVRRMNAHQAPVLAADVPTGLNAFTGSRSSLFVHAHATLTLLGAKAGLFTANGRDACGDIWLHPLGIVSTQEPCALLNTKVDDGLRLHNSHKGSYGDVAIVGGCRGMTGAAILAALGALHGGAGRVYLALLDEKAPTALPSHPELMLRSMESLDFSALTIVAGCGGGSAIHAPLQRILSTSKHLVLDADALNAIANSTKLIALLHQREPHTTVATPHPLEAARLLKTTTALVQANRMQAAQTLSDQLRCTVVLKGSGTLIASPGELPRINTTGNALLATGGTGDVLAGLTGAHLAVGPNAHQSACSAVYAHGHAADHWPSDRHLTAAALAQSL